MSFYSIKDLENLSGIKAHTLRIWEQRFNIIMPRRTESNIRFYNDNDLKMVLNIALLRNNDFKISEIAEMGEDEIKKQIIKLSEQPLNYPDQVHALTIAMVGLEEERFEKIMSVNILRLGFEQTMLNIIFPFLIKIGALWMTGTISPAQEHFISNLIRQKVIVAIDGQINKWSTNAKKFMLFLPDGELHEIALLFANYILKSRNQRVIYLGQSLPFNDIELAYDIYKPDYLFSILTSFPTGADVDLYINKLSGRFSASKIILTGFQVTHPTPKKGNEQIFIFNRFEELSKLLETL